MKNQGDRGGQRHSHGHWMPLLGHTDIHGAILPFSIHVNSGGGLTDAYDTGIIILRMEIDTGGQEIVSTIATQQQGGYFTVICRGLEVRNFGQITRI